MTSFLPTTAFITQITTSNSIQLQPKMKISLVNMSTGTKGEAKSEFIN